MSMRSRVVSGLVLPSVLGLAALAPACAESPPPSVPAPPPPPAPPPTATAPPAPPPAAPAPHNAVDRATFNKIAVHLNLPLFWVSDPDGNGDLEPAEVATLLFYPTSSTVTWVDSLGIFTPSFETAYQQIVDAAKASPNTPSTQPTDDTERRKLVVSDLDQGAPTLVATDLSTLGADDRAFVAHVLKVTDLVDGLYATQVGARALASQVPADDAASQSLFRRDWGPRCLAPLTEKNPKCSAIPGAPKQISDAYPPEIQKNETFCDMLEKLPNAKALMDPFVVVRDHGGKLEPQPYSEAYKAQMEPISAELRATADALKDPSEGALRAYLGAAAQAFLDNNWTPADEAWAKMNATNSQWFLRVGADEVYADPCSLKAGFHVTFARINKESLAWQAKLLPVEQDMEATLAKLIGAPYAARKVSFHLPDFVDIVWNAGDDRKADGATVGQSLPNWGPVAKEGRGRTIAMSNLYTDPDSIATRKARAASLLTTETMASYDTSATPGLLDTILHEATHNLGPAQEYKAKGKTDEQSFGGALASMLEELKAETGAFYFTEYAQGKGIIDQPLAQKTHTEQIVWGFGHISRGMYTATGQGRPYSMLAAIQLGFLMDEGAITWDPNAKAANGTDVGAFTIHFDKLPDAIVKMMKTIGGLKAKGDRAAAEALVKKYVDGTVVPQKTITERTLRDPKASFVYSAKL